MSSLLELLDIRLPILQAPMAGVSTPAMAAAVSNAGGLGAIGVGATDAETARQMIRAVRAASDRPFNVNVFCHRPAVRDGPGRRVAEPARPGLLPVWCDTAERAARDLYQLRPGRRDARHAGGRTAGGRQLPFRHPGRTRIAALRRLASSCLPRPRILVRRRSSPEPGLTGSLCKASKRGSSRRVRSRRA